MDSINWSLMTLRAGEILTAKPTVIPITNGIIKDIAWLLKDIMKVMERPVDNIFEIRGIKMNWVRKYANIILIIDAIPHKNNP